MTGPETLMMAVVLLIFIALAIYFIFYADFTKQCSVCGRRGLLIKYIYINKDIKYYCADCLAHRQNKKDS